MELFWDVFGCFAEIRCGSACHRPHSDGVYSGSEHNQLNSSRVVKHEVGFPNLRLALIGSNQLWCVKDSSYYREYTGIEQEVVRIVYLLRFPSEPTSSALTHQSHMRTHVSRVRCAVGLSNQLCTCVQTKLPRLEARFIKLKSGNATPSWAWYPGLANYRVCHTGWHWRYSVWASNRFRWKLLPSSQAWLFLSTSNCGETAIVKCGNWKWPYWSSAILNLRIQTAVGWGPCLVHCAVPFSSCLIAHLVRVRHHWGFQIGVWLLVHGFDLGGGNICQRISKLYQVDQSFGWDIKAMVPCAKNCIQGKLNIPMAP